MATVAIVGAMALLLNASGIELIADREVDLNRELRAAGAANLVAGLGGGPVGFHALSLTALAQRTGAKSRVVGLVAAAVVALGLLFGASIMSLVPRVVLGGLLLFLGLSFLVEWLIDAWPRLPRADYAVVVLILLVIGAFGFLQGVGFGLALAVILFVVNSSRTDVVKHALDATSLPSNVDRSPEERKVLREHGDKVQVFQLQGFLFFGTANGLLDQVRSRVADPSHPPLRFLVLDFKRVIGLDSSAVLSFTKAVQLAEAEGFTLVLTALGSDVRRRLARGGVEAGERVRFYPDLDRGMELVEDEMLEAAGASTAQTSLLERLIRTLGREVEDLLVYLERMEAETGEEIIRQGDPSGDVFFLESGRLSVQLRQDDGEVVRLRSMGPGTVVGEVAMYLGASRTASVVAEVPSVLYRLPAGSLEAMERTDPGAAAAMHRFFAHLLSDRLADTLRSMSALMD
jgi:SulP family sulfate permease